MNKTRIDWADFSWNPVTGCSPVSEGCEKCYAEKLSKRFNGGDFSVKLHPERLDEPMRLKKPARIFVCSMSDLFHPDVPDEFIDKVFAVMAQAPQHTFMVLTKRPERIKDYISDLFDVVYPSAQWPLPNVWLGVTAENQARADERIPILLQTPAAKRFVSIEPMLGEINLRPVLGTWRRSSGVAATERGLDWVIVGGETGPGARECREEWVQGVYNQCQAAGVPFFFKQYGNKWDIWETRREWPK